MTPEEIRAARKRSGLTQVDFARRLQVSLSTVKKWETGRRHPCCHYMIRALKRYGRRR